MLDWLKRMFGGSFSFKHQTYLFASKMLTQLQEQTKDKTQKEIDLFFERKQAELKMYFMEP